MIVAVVDDDDSSSLCRLEFHHQPIVRDENLLFLFPFVSMIVISLLLSVGILLRWRCQDGRSRYSLFGM
jgi:hypothetical protein